MTSSQGDLHATLDSLLQQIGLELAFVDVAQENGIAGMHEQVLALAAAQLADVDQAVRLLGLQELKSAPASVGVPLAASLLDDPDAAVAGLNSIAQPCPHRLPFSLLSTASRQQPYGSTTRKNAVSPRAGPLYTT